MFRRLVSLVMPIEQFSREDRRLVFLMWTAGIVQGYAAAHAVNTEPFARLSLSLSTAEMSRLFSITRIGALVAVGFAWWGDAHGRRRPFLAGLTALVLASAATGLTQNAAQYGAAQTLTRLGATATGVLGAVILVEAVSVRVRAYALSLYGAAASFGAGLATMALPISDVGPEAWRWVFGSTVVGLMLVPVLARRLPTAPLKGGQEGNAWFSDLDHPGRFWLLAGASFGIAAFSALAVSFSFERLVNGLGWTGAQAAVVSLTGGTLGGIGFFAGGRMADGWGRRPTAMVGVICGLVGGIALFWVTSIPWITAAIFVSAFGSFTLVPALGTLRNELFAESIRTRAVTWVNNVAVVGSVTGLSVGAVAIDRYGLSWTITGLGTMSLVAIAFLALLPETLQIGQAVRVTDPRQA